MARYKAVLLDLGGVVYLGEELLPGALEAIARLREAGLPLRFLTNTTRTPHGRLLVRLRAMGIELDADELIAPSLAARRILAEQGLTPHLLVHPDLIEDFSGLPVTEREAVVIGDAADSFTYAAMNAAFRALERGAEFLALANNRYFRSTDGGLDLDAGPFVAALAFASRREPVMLGKPAPDAFIAAVRSTGCAPGETVMIGDDAENDVGGALAAGLDGILVRTGKYEPGAEATIDPPPTHIADNIAAAIDWILSG